MAQHSGFFNALESGGVYDRKYNADDYTSNMAAIISTGVRRSGNDDLKVTASGLNVTVAVGRAWIDGRWFYNDTALQLATVTPPVGTLTRVDGVYLQANENVAVRNIQLVYKTGTPSSNPTAPACTRQDGVYEIQLASIAVAPNAASVTVTDTRGDTSVCGWVTSPVGYSDYFTSLDNEFNSWFTEAKDTLASVTLFKQYTWRTVTSSTTSTVSFSIPQYDPTGVDIINVYVNGLLETPTDDYTLSGSTITFTNAKTAGTEVVVICYKSIDGTGLGSVSDEIRELQNEVAALGNINDFYYFCNGQNDNVQLSEIVQNFLSASATDNKTMKLHVVGTFGAATPAAGSGTEIVRFRWFNFEAATPTNRRVTLDFHNSTPVNIRPQDGSYNCIFYGGNYAIEGLTLTAGGSTYTNLHVDGISGAAAAAPVAFFKSKIEITAAWSGGAVYFTEYGEFDDCEITVSNALNSAAVFAIINNADFIQVRGGKYTAYTGQSNGYAAGVYSAAGAATGAAVTVGVRFPEISRASYYQTHAALLNGGKATMLGAITALDITADGSAEANVYGTIALNKA